MTPTTPRPAKVQVRIVKSADAAAVEQLVAAAAQRDPRITRRVAQIVADVRSGGDDAVVDYARRLDALEGPVEVTLAQMRREARSVPAEVRHAIGLAVRNIRLVAKRQVPKSWARSTATGHHRGRVTPPGPPLAFTALAPFPAPSSLLMTAVTGTYRGCVPRSSRCPRPMRR